MPAHSRMHLIRLQPSYLSLVSQVFNVAAIGKFDFIYVARQSETTVFVLGRTDQIGLQLAYLPTNSSRYAAERKEHNAFVSVGATVVEPVGAGWYCALR